MLSNANLICYVFGVRLTHRPLECAPENERNECHIDDNGGGRERHQVEIILPMEIDIRLSQVAGNVSAYGYREDLYNWTTDTL